MTERTGRMVKMLEKDTAEEMSSKEQTDHLLELINGPEIIEEAQFLQYKNSMLFTA